MQKTVRLAHEGTDLFVCDFGATLMMVRMWS